MRCLLIDSEGDLFFPVQDIRARGTVTHSGNGPNPCVSARVMSALQTVRQTTMRQTDRRDSQVDRDYGQGEREADYQGDYDSETDTETGRCRERYV